VTTECGRSSKRTLCLSNVCSFPYDLGRAGASNLVKLSIITRRGVHVSAVLLVLTACAPSPRLYWYKAGATQQDFARDDYQCRRENTMTGSDTIYTAPNTLFPGGMVMTAPTAEVDPDLYARCMAARGYILQQEAEAAPAPSVPPTPRPTPTSSSPTPIPPASNVNAPAKKPDSKTVPLCPWGEYFSSVQKKCVSIGSE
jgi:hypothetical protein